MRTLRCLLILFAAAFSGAGGESRAACGFLSDGLTYAMNNYRAYKAENQGMQDRLAAAAADCHEKGAAESEKAQALAAGLSCTSQNEVSQLNAGIASLGQKCEAIFSELKALQSDLHQRFGLLQADLTNGVAIMKKDALLQRYCTDEITVGGTMVDAYLALEGNIVDVREQAHQGEDDYQKLKATGELLAEQTKSLGAGCASDARGPAIVAADAKAAAAPVPAGMNTNGSSDITGTEKAIQLEQVSDKILSEE